MTVREMAEKDREDSRVVDKKEDEKKYHSSIPPAS